ncbi:ThiF family adenylyltransferase [Nocardia sp. NBC_00565]|uniref:ThiF family adenylyltransferase n=1 Tax=Nocardia sp. NBC_00565 TaxID=2975993 RepID=UPI002E7FF2B0|nr:ThiF family adenylyltransferase [Nocardia sp. NBC_00565]WUC07422.1 ThiF family adenylyltransferase [Nocardia sp. NBC_00565]
MIEILHPTTDSARIAELLDSGFRYVDAWAGSLAELVVLDQFHLAADTPEARVERANHIAALRFDELAARYVVFPWRRTVVKMPDTEQFWRLRTARNRYLVDIGEQRTWSEALIGIAGLSVGAAALSVCSLTGARRFRLAERDTLSATNLNRLAASVCDLGEPKLLLAQRRTLEIDPYTRIDAFPDGYAPEVADAFLGGHGTDRLAVLLEEMDDLPMKFDIRRRAKAARIPVVMVTDNGDNVLVDIERYDLDPAYPILHGRAEFAARWSLAELGDPARRLRLVDAIVGSRITPRMRYSLTQVGRTLPTWPQLGTAAAVAGAVGAMVARLIACGSGIHSGRYRVDLDELLLGAAAGETARWNTLGEAEFRAAMHPGEGSSPATPMVSRAPAHRRGRCAGTS